MCSNSQGYYDSSDLPISLGNGVIELVTDKFVVCEVLLDGSLEYAGTCETFEDAQQLVASLSEKTGKTYKVIIMVFMNYMKF